MANDPEKKSAHGDQDKPKDAIEERGAEEVTARDCPTCPQCGWHSTRLSHTRSMLDSILRRFSLRAFRCRTCGNRFRALRRVPKV